MSDYRRRRSLVWPLVLISLGVVFLLNNLGVVSWDVWSLLWRMWPVLVVAIGLDMIIGRRPGIWPIVTVVVVIGLFAGAFWLFGATGYALAGDQVITQIAQGTDNAALAEVTIRMNIGTMNLDVLEDSPGILVEGMIETSEFENVVENYNISGNVVKYSLSSSGQQYNPGWLFSKDVDQEKSWDLLLSPDVEMDLQVDSGVGRTELNLTKMTLSHLDVDSGVGEVVVFLPEEGDFDANLNSGVGKIEVFIPANVAVRIAVDSGLGNVSLKGDFVQRNGYYYTDAFDPGSASIDVYLDGGVGNISVVLLDE